MQYVLVYAMYAVQYNMFWHKLYEIVVAVGVLSINSLLYNVLCCLVTPIW